MEVRVAGEGWCDFVFCGNKIQTLTTDNSDEVTFRENSLKHATSLVTILSRDRAVKVSSDMSYVFRDRYCTAAIADWKIANWLIPSLFNNRFDPDHGNHGGRSLR